MIFAVLKFIIKRIAFDCSLKIVLFSLEVTRSVVTVFRLLCSCQSCFD